MKRKVRGPRGTEPEWLPRAAELRERGWSYKRIGREVGDHPGCVHYFLNTGRFGQRACEECGVEFEPRAATAKLCSPKCVAAVSHRKAAANGKNSSSRKGALNPYYKHGRRAGVRNRKGERSFVDAVLVCRHPNCPAMGLELDQHHVVYRQELRRHGGDEWDSTNALALCHGCHASHHNRGSRVVPLVALRDENYAYALVLLGAGPAYEYLRRRYKGDDPRLEKLKTMADRYATESTRRA